MVEKKIKALRDFQFTNFSGTHFLVKDEVKRIQFLNMTVFREHLKAGWMVEADLREEEDKTIPVVFPPVSEEISVDPVEGIEPDKLDLPYPGELEDKETPDLRRSEPPIEEFEPNVETVEAMEETERGEDLHEVGSVEELIEELDEDDGDAPELN